MGKNTRIDGRPRLPEFNPIPTPDVHDLAVWDGIVVSGTMRRYAAETLLLVHDGALSTKADTLAALLYKEVWDAGERYLARIVERCCFGVVKSARDGDREENKHLVPDTSLVTGRTKDYLRNAMTVAVRADGTPNPDCDNIRGGFYRFVGKRCIDAARTESRTLRQSERAIERAKTRKEEVGATLRRAKENNRLPLNGKDLDFQTIYQNDTNRIIIDRYLNGDSWNDIAKAAKLNTPDAARKRFFRLVERWATWGTTV